MDEVFIDATKIMLYDWFILHFNCTYPAPPHYAKIKSIDNVLSNKIKCEPLYISEEVLALNGFEKKDEGIYTGWGVTVDMINYSHPCVSVGYVLQNYPFEYVHELQQILRLFVKVELANNFKIQ